MAELRLLNQVRSAIRVKHYSYSTEKTYVQWIYQYICFHGRVHPQNLGESHISQYITYLATKKNVSPATQNQALCAIVFLYKEILKKDLGDFQITWAKKPEGSPLYFPERKSLI